MRRTARENLVELIDAIKAEISILTGKDVSNIPIETLINKLGSYADEVISRACDKSGVRLYRRNGNSKKDSLDDIKEILNQI